MSAGMSAIRGKSGLVVLNVSFVARDPQQTRGEKNRGFCRTESITVASGSKSQSPLSSPHARKCYGETIGGAGSAVDRRQEGGSLQLRPGRIMTEPAVFLGPRNGPSSQKPGFGSSLVTTAVTTRGGAINRSWDLPALLWKWYYSCRRCFVSSLAPIQELVRDPRFSSNASTIFSNISAEIGFCKQGCLRQYSISVGSYPVRNANGIS
jgi:hypothetical protein